MYPFTAICRDTTLVPTWLVGPRTSDSAYRFLLDVARRMQGRFQLTTDGANTYRQTAWDAFAAFAGFAQLVKLYERPVDDERS
ncbi:MAG: hypothetical protein F4Y02_18045 [Chloroflexi bacterium]|nr:hypothetical protein [Chloroflexota bacterium]